MVVIRHKYTGIVLHTVRADTLCEAKLRGAHLSYADLNGADLNGTDLIGADLNGTDLNGARLIGADLSRADLRGVHLNKAHLNKARLIGARLIGADLSEANLSEANLKGACLSEADLRGVHLNKACLNGARLIGADLSRADLSNADLKEAELGYTNFVRCNTLHQAKNLESIKHWYASSLDGATLRASIAYLSDVFLQGVGYTNEEIENLRAIYNQGIQYYSCFLSSTTANADFADRIRTDLISNNITCWHYRHDMKGGKFWRPQINEAIKLHDKLVFVASEQSVQRPEVVREILEAIEQERKTEQQKLFPLRLDDFILSKEALRFADKNIAASAWPEDWIRYIRQFHIPDFSAWKDHDAYTQEFQKLLRDLKEPARRSRLAIQPSS